MFTLAIVGFLMILVFMYVVMSKKATAMVGLILIPILFALGLGFGPKLGTMIFDGVKKVAPTAIMIVFAVMYFGIMINAGLFDRLVSAILKATKGDPVRIFVGTSILAFCVSLDGDGVTTYMVTCTAMMPLIRQLGLNPLMAATVAIMPASITNILPWGGPTARVMTVLSLDINQVFIPLIPGMVIAVLYSLGVAYYFGQKERKRLGFIPGSNLNAHEAAATVTADENVNALKRPQMFWFNFSLTIVLLVGLVAEIMPLAVLFMIGSSLALVVNYPNVKDQQARITAQGENILPVITMIFAAGTLTGIMSGTKMLDQMAQFLVTIIPSQLGPHLGVVMAGASLPLTYFLTNDAVYFGIMPVIVKTAAAYGISSAEIARALLVGQCAHLLSPMVASTYLLVNLTGVNYGEFQKFALLWANGSSIIMLLVVLAMGLVPL
ncbi:CitMHS family transporter [Anaerospora hongkongensis]|uniref:CitMHS family transporter n=1 Tax=Anaerospora hongkongensis TaxID=244830 RepID=UPI00289E161F|nr:citrate:proton symporter [Anaerospora hongkongensis]